MKKALIFLSFLLILASCTPLNEGNKGDETPSIVSSESRTVSTPTYGSGKHTVEIFADFQCPACIYFANNIGLILEGYAEKGQLKIVYRQYPLNQIHKNANRDAIAALCAQEQGKYMDYKKALYALEEEKSQAKVTDEDRIATAKSVGLNDGDMKACLTVDRYQAQVLSDTAYGDTLRIEGTPTVFLDGTKLDLGVFNDNTQLLISFLDRLVKE